jgi:hypothetical protein
LLALGRTVVEERIGFVAGVPRRGSMLEWGCAGRTPNFREQIATRDSIYIRFLKKLLFTSAQLLTTKETSTRTTPHGKVRKARLGEGWLHYPGTRVIIVIISWDCGKGVEISSRGGNPSPSVTHALDVTLG